MDITTYTMILTCKLSALAFCYKDGGERDENLLPEQKERKVVIIPSPLEMMSYVFFSSACLCGPFFEYADYINYIERRGVFEKVPGTVVPGLLRLGQGMLCLVINIVGSNYYWIPFCATAEFAAMSFPQKLIYYYLAMTIQRFKYYTAWCITDGAMITSGLGYAGKDPKTGKDRFDRIVSIDILGVELGNSPNTMMQHWNHMIHIWLKHYVYNRTLVPGKKPTLYNSMAVFMVSAFWHGFYPFYYVMFFFTAFLGELAKDVYRSRVFFRFIPHPFGHILANILTMMSLNYLGTSFGLLTFELGYNFSKAMHHFVFIYIMVLFAIFRFGGIPRKAQKLEEQLAKK